MVRTQIYLTEEEGQLLDRASRATGASRSELIRRAIRLAYAGRDAEHRQEALRASSGSWRNRRFTGAAYVDAVRDDLNERLRQLGIED